jgi:hypothetical protein
MEEEEEEEKKKRNLSRTKTTARNLYFRDSKLELFMRAQVPSP